ncbi:flavin-dependent oxidoreductase [Streptomyces sp. NBC_01465]|uniref:flavin-dependent oxidoreductase n=1 Tax=Streptomyces sp. NBC_01465 TaxID=2903878 RepID=UPI002E2FC64D|nr:flavin-dependent oxidoreductase [Streptomyces sp. NBC_01465]
MLRTQPQPQPRILIAGGGIAGLTAALSLHAAGFEEITVIEAAREIQPVGAGLNIMPNAVRELDALGLLERLDATAVRTRELRYYHRSGGLISREARGLGAGYRWPQLSVQRGDLQMALADAVRARLGEQSLVPGVRVTAVGQLPGGKPRVELRHRDEGALASLAPDVLIGADGIRSVVRAALVPGEGEPPWNGMLVWRGTSWMDADRAGTFMLIAGDNRQKAVVYPMAEPEGGRVLVNWALALPAEAVADPGDDVRGDWNRPVPVTKFLHHYEGWVFDGVDVAEILRAADGAYEYPMVDREPLARWTHGRTTLIGDAAHAMYPIGSNGATQSIVDARALAHALATCDTTDEGLAAYENDRRPAMSQLQLSNRQLGPEVVINLAHERAPGGFTDINDVIPAEELDAIAARYAATGAFDAAAVNQGSPYDVVRDRVPAA